MTGAAIAIGRVAGIALLSLGVGCWMGRHEPGISSALTAMLVYNLLVTIYLISLGIGGELVGILLWSAIASSREDSISARVSGLKNLGISLSGMGGSPFESRFLKTILSLRRSWPHRLDSRCGVCHKRSETRAVDAAL